MPSLAFPKEPFQWVTLEEEFCYGSRETHTVSQGGLGVTGANQVQLSPPT